MLVVAVVLLLVLLQQARDTGSGRAAGEWTITLDGVLFWVWLVKNYGDNWM